ncbi:MAG: hypothetical protein OHK006_13200 [Thermodesulfovibrionales bacterium]
MASATGSEIKAAVKKASAWGTAVAVGANNGLLIRPSNIKKDRPSEIDDSLGLYFPKDSDIGEIKAEGSVEAWLRYDSLDLMIALAMGATGGAPTQQGATPAYAQKFTLANTLDGLFATFCINNQINIDECPSLKVTGFTIKGEVGKALSITFDVVAIDKITGSVTNTLVTFANVTYFETANRVLYSQGVIRMNAQSGGALGSGDTIYPRSFELSFKRKMSGVYGAGSFDKIDEPTNDGLPEVKLKLEFPRYTSAGYFTDWDANAAKKLDMTFTGGLIASTYYRTFKISLPNLKFAGVDLPIEQGILKHPVEFNCLACDAAPTGMSGITLPFQIDVINRQSTNVLA